MEKTNRYNMEGIVLEIPLRWDEYSRKFVEDYSDFIKHPVHTPAGHPRSWNPEYRGIHPSPAPAS